MHAAPNLKGRSEAASSIALQNTPRGARHRALATSGRIWLAARRSLADHRSRIEIDSLSKMCPARRHPRARPVQLTAVLIPAKLDRPEVVLLPGALADRIAASIWTN